MIKNINNKLNPKWITDFTDAEGCFTLYLKKGKTKLEVTPCFAVELHSKDLDLLLQIKSFFNNIGYINIYTNKVLYRVCKLNDLVDVIIPHFEKYPLISQKFSDFILFKKIVKLIKNKEHLNEEGLMKIINLKASLNKGLSNKLIASFLKFVQ